MILTRGEMVGNNNIHIKCIIYFICPLMTYPHDNLGGGVNTFGVVFFIYLLFIIDLYYAPIHNGEKTIFFLIKNNLCGYFCLNKNIKQI